MNRKETAEQLSNMIANNLPNLKPQEIATLILAKKEFEKNCSNCAHQYRNGSRGDYCGYYEFYIPDADEWFCANHQKDIFHLNNEV